ncbi:uncharacterized protein LOC117805449 [Notolabrus celidotus]|uniref:uncharacterized protein LOC117805449 n=1 Tax=Notolabrus celidotus TaxID=1203425 RepID=UPI00148FE51A|nr:uncharacterized protein LOC117805449 [Notolabrus celidotus]
MDNWTYALIYLQRPHTANFPKWRRSALLRTTQLPLCRRAECHEVMRAILVRAIRSERCMKIIMLIVLLLVLLGEAGLCLEQEGEFHFKRDIRHFSVANNTVYIATERRLYQLSHDLTLVQSLTQRGILIDPLSNNPQFNRVSETDTGNTTFSVNVLLPLVADENLITCGVFDSGCGYCELLDLKNVSNVLYKEHIQVGSLWRSSASVSFLVNVETRTRTETYILAAVQQYRVKPSKASCPPVSHAINSIIYLFSNLPSGDQNNKVRLLWLEGKGGKPQTLKSLRGATLSVSNGGRGCRLIASSVIPGGPPMLWIGVFSVEGGQTNTELVLFDISPDLSGGTDTDPDFCVECSKRDRPEPKTLRPEKVIFRQDFMTSVLAVRQKEWTVLFIGTGDGQLIKLSVDKNYHNTCPTVLYKTSDDRKVFSKLHLDQVDLKHVYVPFQNQINRVPVSKCSTYKTLQDCWSAQDPYCVWCGSKNRCRKCIEAGCDWTTNGCSWANQGVGNDSVCQKMESWMNFTRPEISSITPSVVSFYGRNHAVLSGSNLSPVTGVRIQADMDCTPQESPVWNNTGEFLTFHIPSAEDKGVVQVCVLLPDNSCYSNAKVTYRSAPSCTNISPNSTWSSGKRKITILGSHLEYVEAVKHSQVQQEVRLPGNINYQPLQNLTYDSPAAENTHGTFSSTLYLKVANESLACSTGITYYPDPEFTMYASPYRKRQTN